MYTQMHTHTHTHTELPSRMLLDAAVQRVLSEHSYAQLPLNKRYSTSYLCLFLYLNINMLPMHRCARLLRSVHNMMLYHTLRCVAFVLTLVATQRNARIDSDPILVFLCVVSLRLITKKSRKGLIRNICVSQINTTQGLASYCEPAFKLGCSWDNVLLCFMLTMEPLLRAVYRCAEVPSFQG